MNVLKLSPLQKRNFHKIIPFGFAFFLFGVIWALIERSLLGDLDYYPATGIPYDFGNSLFAAGIGSLFMGWWFGIFEIFFVNRFFVNSSFGKKLIFKTIIYIIVLYMFLIKLTTIASMITHHVPFFDEKVLREVGLFSSSISLWGQLIYMGTVISILLFFSEISDNLGQGVLKNFFIGKYHVPREEKRIFMFLDMKSSTTIAEKLGHVKYYKLLNMYYADITQAILQTSGEIYQYVGDEIVVSWKMENGIKNNNCLSCFFTIKDIFKKASSKYLSVFGTVPEFKAGLHYGKVVTGEVGVVKKEIIFTGDVLNTTARIQSRCNHYNADMLISYDLATILEDKGDYIFNDIGECKLKGKVRKVILQAVKRCRN